MEELEIKDKLVSFKIIPNMDYQPIEIDTNFKLELDESMNVVKIILSITDKDKLEDYPYCINLKLTEDGEIKFKFNHNNTTNINEVLKYNKMMNIWRTKGFRRLYIMDNEGNTPISTVLEENDKMENENKFIDNLISALRENGEIIDCIPSYISSDAVSYVESCYLENDSKQNIELVLLDKMKDKLPPKVTGVRLFLINEENKYIVSVAHLGYLPYLLDMGEFQIKTSNKQKNKEVKEILENGDLDLRLEKYIFNVAPIEIYKEIKTMFYSTNRPLEKITSYILNDKGEKALGKIHINMSKKYSIYWHDEIQNVDIKVYICEEEISKINELDLLNRDKKYVQAISLMERFQHRSFVSKENLAFAYCLNKDFNKSIELCECIIRENYKSITHFTKGLALVMKGELEKAYTSYMCGLHLIDKSIWYPEIKNNLLCEIEKGGIEKDDFIKKIIENIELYNISNSNGRYKSCFCGSNRKFKNCHERKLIEAINAESF